MVQPDVPVVWSPDTRLHDPLHEVWVGRSTPATEIAARVDVILEALEGHPLVEASPHDDTILRRVHSDDLLEFLRTANTRWQEADYAGLVGQERVVPYLFPTPAFTEGMPVRQPISVHVLAGQFAYDTMTLVGPGTWQAARAAVDCVLTAVRLVADGAPVAYALSRPPGHHATRGGYGGSCYLNNAAVAAEGLRDTGHERVAIVDVDAHQGNGTAAIFYDRDDVSYGSVHVDPGAGWFPHVLGYADETGSGAGEGATLNIPLPEGADDALWTDAVEDLAEWVLSRRCTALVVSLGVDAAADDPESPLLVTAAGYERAGRFLGDCGLPSVVVQEGGYHLPTLGHLVASYLRGHARSAGRRGRT